MDGKTFYVKRDDLIDSFLAGNKFRKLYSLIQTPQSKYNKIISYGGVQSNAMLAIAYLCQMKNWEFVYYTKPIAQRVKEQDEGNFHQSKLLGMKHREVLDEDYRTFIASLNFNLDSTTYLLDQGGADSLAHEGIKVLAQEIKDSKLEVNSIALPSGTGTTALYLALCLPEYKVYTVACIGDSSYLKEQMQALESIPNNLIILEPKKKYHFAKPYEEFFKLYENLLDSTIEFDLLYAPLMWQTLLENKKENVLYLHTGGVSGNKSMLERYTRKKIKSI